MRTPVGVTLVEDGPTRATTRRSSVSTCGAIVDRMLVVARANDPSRTLESYLADFLVELDREGYRDATRGATTDTRRLLMTDIVFQTTSNVSPARVFIAVVRKDEDVFVIFYQTRPKQWVEVEATFESSAKSVVVVPKEWPHR